MSWKRNLIVVLLFLISSVFSFWSGLKYTERHPAPIPEPVQTIEYRDTCLTGMSSEYFEILSQTKDSILEVKTTYFWSVELPLNIRHYSNHTGTADITLIDSLVDTLCFEKCRGKE